MRPPVAAVLGIALALTLSIVGDVLAAAILAAPDAAPLPIGRTYLSATLAITFGASVLGGFVAAHASKAHRMRVALAVAVSAALFGVLSALDTPTDTPAPIVWASPILAFVGAVAGGGIRLMNPSARSAV